MGLLFIFFLFCRKLYFFFFFFFDIHSNNIGLADGEYSFIFPRKCDLTFYVYYVSDFHSFLCSLFPKATFKIFSVQILEIKVSHYLG